MKYKAIIFDLDGTLVDTLADLADAMNAALKQYELPTHRADAVRFMIGNGVHVFAKKALPPDKQDLKYDILNAMRQHYSENCCKSTVVYEGMDETVRILRDQGVRLAVVTNKDQALAEKVAGHFFPSGTFAQIMGVTSDDVIKPDPTSTLFVVNALGLSPDDFLFIGDSDVDIQTAKNAGIRSVGAAWGFRGRDELKAAQADIIIDSPREILDLSP
jgi:phosphoglycolate phosphatase